MEDPIFLSTTSGLIVFLILITWSSIWKGVALWKAGRNKDLTWFIIIFIFNTIGILEILYIYLFSKKRK